MRYSIALCVCVLIGVCTVTPAIGQVVADTETNKIAYMGVGTSPVADALADRLAMPDGIGLSVDYIDPSSSAARTLAVNDVLQKLDDQMLVSHYQLAILVRTYEPGEDVTLTLVREGRTNDVNVKLGKKDWIPLPKYGATIIGAPFRPSIRRTFTNFPAFPDWLQGRMTPGACAGKPGRDGRCCAKHSLRSRSSSCGIMTMIDGEHEITVRVDSKGDRHMTALNSDGETVFDGPINNEDEIEQVPHTLRGALQELLKLGNNVIDKAAPGNTSSRPAM